MVFQITNLLYSLAIQQNKARHVFQSVLYCRSYEIWCCIQYVLEITNSISDR